MKRRMFAMAAMAIVLALLTACAPSVPAADDPVPATDSGLNVAADSSDAPPAPDATDAPAPPSDVPESQDSAWKQDDPITNDEADPSFGAFLETKPEGVTAAGEDIPPEYAGRTVITLAAKTDAVFGYYDGSLGKILQAFHEAQDEVYIQTKSFQDGFHLIPPERIYAEIINGDRADLYDTGMLQFDSEKLDNAGLIQDWYPVLEADPALEMDDYLTNVWRTLEAWDGRLLELCSGYTLRYALKVPAPLAEGLDTYDGFLAYLQENDLTVSQQHVLVEAGEYYLDWIDTETMTCDFQSESFLEWLHFFAALPPERNRDTDVQSGVIANLPRFKSDSEEFGCWLRYLEIPSRDPHTPRVYPWDSFSLSSTTEHRDACMKFIRWLLSYDTQQQYYGKPENGIGLGGNYALPVNRAVWERNLERIQLGGEEDASMIGIRKNFERRPMYPDLGRDDFLPGLPAEEAEYLRRMVESVDRKQTDDGSDAGIIFYQELEVFRHGDMTAEECAERLQQRFTIYLAERQ